MSLRCAGSRRLQTTKTSILDGQATASLALWVRLNGDLEPSSKTRRSALIFGHPGIFDGLALGIGPGHELNAYFRVGRTNVRLESPLILGMSYHVAVVQDAGTQRLYVNGELVKSAARPGVLGEPGRPPEVIRLGSDQSWLDLTLDDPTIWTGYALTAEDVRNLRNRTVHPEGVAPKHLAWRLTLDGPAGAAAVAGDTGRADRGPHKLDLAAAPAAQPPVYEAGPLSFVPTARLRSAMVGPSGKTIACLFEDLNGVLTNLKSLANPTVTITGDGTGATAEAVLAGGVQAIRVTKAGTGYTTATATINGGTGTGAVAGAVTITSGGVAAIAVANAGAGYGPTISVAGGPPIGLSDPIWGPDSTHTPSVSYLPFVIFPLASAIPAGSAVTLTFPDGWASTVAGDIVTPKAMTVVSQAGGSFLPKFAAAPKTMRVGTNLLFPSYYLPQNIYANVVTQGPPAVNADALGVPTTFPIAMTLVVSGSDSTDPLRYPVTAPDGVWTLKWDGPYSANLKLSSSNSITNQLLSDVPGTNNKDNTRTYRITADLTQRHCPIITLTFVAAGATNVRVYPPGEATDGTQLFGANLLRQAAGYQCLRYMNSTLTGFSPVIEYSDFANPNQLTFQSLPATAVGGPIVSLDPYTRTDNFFDPAMCAFIVTFANPHGATTGQILQFNSGIQAPNSDGTFPTTTGGKMSQLNYGKGVVRVLNDHQVATQHFAGAGGTLTQSYPQTGITFQMARNGGMPPEHCATLSSQLGADAWVNVPHAASDACVTAMAQHVVANLRPGLKCYVEYTNEHWNTSNNFEQNQYLNALGRTMPGTGATATAQVGANKLLTGLTLTSPGTGYVAAPMVTITKSPTGSTATAHATFLNGKLALVLDSAGGGYDPANPPTVTIDPAVDLTTAYTWRAGQVHAIFASVFAAAGRSADLVRLMGTQYSSPNGPTAKIIIAAIRNGITFDALAGAPYWDNTPGKNEPTIATAFDRLDVDMLHDFNQLCMLYGTIFAPIPTHRALLDAAGFTNVQMICYEGGPQDGTPLGVNDRIHRSRAWARHPRMRELMLSYLQRLQDAGITLYVDFLLNYTITDSENPNSSGASPANWATYFSRQQVAGKGDGSDGLFDNRTNYFDTSQVVSVKGDALATWAGLAHPTAPQSRVPRAVPRVLPRRHDAAPRGGAGPWGGATPPSPSRRRTR